MPWRPHLQKPGAETGSIVDISENVETVILTTFGRVTIFLRSLPVRLWRVGTRRRLDLRDTDYGQVDSSISRSVIIMNENEN